MHCVDTSPKLGYNVYKQTQVFFVSQHAAKLLFLHKKGSAYALLRNVSIDKMKMLLPAVITAHYVLKNAAKEIVFAGNRLVLRVPFDMCIRKDAICSVVSARSVDERRLILQEMEAPCRARCHQHFCTIAHKALDTPVHL